MATAKKAENQLKPLRIPALMVAFGYCITLFVPLIFFYIYSPYPKCEYVCAPFAMFFLGVLCSLFGVYLIAFMYIDVLDGVDSFAPPGSEPKSASVWRMVRVAGIMCVSVALLLIAFGLSWKMTKC